MDSLTQEALSHQHYGLWCVPLAGGTAAVFTHPNGTLLRICPWADVPSTPIQARWPVYTTPLSTLDLGGIDDL